MAYSFRSEFCRGPVSQRQRGPTTTTTVDAITIDTIPRNTRALLKTPAVIKPVEVATGLNPTDFNANWQNFAEPP
jgi:hypothetical protein